MKLDKSTNILIVGLGVIGGGYAKALSKQGFRVCALTKDQADIDYALENGMIAEGSTEASAELIGKAELIICALYPHVFIAT
jgi:prephenate dehydrogenase